MRASLENSVQNSEKNENDRVDDRKKFLRIAEVTELLGLSRSMIYKCMKDPMIRLPSPVKIGVSSRWDRDEMIEWMEAFQAKR